MIYSFPQLQNKSRYLTYGIVKCVLEKAGHQVLDELSTKSDAVLYSACDVMDMRKLRMLRRETTKPIIVGGHYSFNFWSAILYSDIVWLGEVFDFAKLNTIKEISQSRHTYTGNEDWESLIVSERIDWDILPVIQQKKTSAYYLGGVGCKNNCHFCFTSWTHNHQRNTDKNIKKALRLCKDKGIYLMTVSNQYDYNPGMQTHDMLLSDYLCTPIDGGIVRMGVEFATENIRNVKGKPITKDELFAALQKSIKENIGLRLFHIGGYEEKDKWDNYMRDWAEMLYRYPNNRLLDMQFTNLQYQNYTPMYAERCDIDYRKYLDIIDVKRWYNLLRQYSAHIMIGRPSAFGHVAWRMGVELSTTKKQAEFWMKKYHKRNKYKMEDMQVALYDSRVLETPKVLFIKKDGTIKVTKKTP